MKKRKVTVSLRISLAVFLAALYLVPIMGFLLPLQAAGCLIWALLVDRDEELGLSFRANMTVQANVHGAILLWLLRCILGFKVNFTFDRRGAPEVLEEPMIVVPNHLSIMDIPLAVGAMRFIGRGSLRWILKIMPWWLPLGWAARWIRCGYVKREGPATRDEDLASVRDCGRSAYHDGDDVLIFPQGTRKATAKDNRPKRGGFDALRLVMPKSDIVKIIFRWHGAGDEPIGRTFLEAAAALPGRTIDVDVSYWRRSEVGDGWLDEHFGTRHEERGS